MKLSRNKIAKLLKTGNQSRRRFRSKSLTNKDLILDVNTSGNNTSLTPSLLPQAKTKAKTAAKTEKKHRQSMKKKRRGLNLRYKTLKRWGGAGIPSDSKERRLLERLLKEKDGLKSVIGPILAFNMASAESKQKLKEAFPEMSDDDKKLINDIPAISENKREIPKIPTELPSFNVNKSTNELEDVPTKELEDVSTSSEKTAPTSTTSDKIKQIIQSILDGTNCEFIDVAFVPHLTTYIKSDAKNKYTKPYNSISQQDEAYMGFPYPQQPTTKATSTDKTKFEEGLVSATEFENVHMLKPEYVLEKDLNDFEIPTYALADNTSISESELDSWSQGPSIPVGKDIPPIVRRNYEGGLSLTKNPLDKLKDIKTNLDTLNTKIGEYTTFFNSSLNEYSQNDDISLNHVFGGKDNLHNRQSLQKILKEGNIVYDKNVLVKTYGKDNTKIKRDVFDKGDYKFFNQLIDMKTDNWDTNVNKKSSLLTVNQNLFDLLTKIATRMNDVDAGPDAGLAVTKKIVESIPQITLENIIKKSFLGIIALFLSIYTGFNKCQEDFDEWKKNSDKFKDRIDIQKIYQEIENTLAKYKKQFDDGTIGGISEIRTTTANAQMNTEITEAKDLTTKAINDPNTNLTLIDKLKIKYYLQYLAYSFIVPNGFLETDITKNQCINVLNKIKNIVANKPITLPQVVVAPALVAEGTVPAEGILSAVETAPASVEISAESIDDLIKLFTSEPSGDVMIAKKKKLTELLTPNGAIYEAIYTLEANLNFLRARTMSNGSVQPTTTNIYELLEYVIGQKDLNNIYEHQSGGGVEDFDSNVTNKTIDTIYNTLTEVITDKIGKVQSTDKATIERIDAKAAPPPQQLSGPQFSPPQFSPQQLSGPQSSSSRSIQESSSETPKVKSIRSESVQRQPARSNMNSSSNLASALTAAASTSAATSEQAPGEIVGLTLKNEPSSDIIFKLRAIPPQAWASTTYNTTEGNIRNLGADMMGSNDRDKTNVLLDILRTEKALDEIGVKLAGTAETLSNVQVTPSTLQLIGITGPDAAAKDKATKQLEALKPMIDKFRKYLEALKSVNKQGGGGQVGGNRTKRGSFNLPPTDAEIDLLMATIKQNDKIKELFVNKETLPTLNDISNKLIEISINYFDEKNTNNWTKNTTLPTNTKLPIDVLKTSINNKALADKIPKKFSRNKDLNIYMFAMTFKHTSFETFYNNFIKSDDKSFENFTTKLSEWFKDTNSKDNFGSYWTVLADGLSNTLKGENENLKRKIAQLEKDLTEANATIKELNGQLTALNTRQTATEKELEKLRAEATAAEAAAAEARAEIEGLNTEQNKKKSEHEAALKALEEAKSKVVSELETLKSSKGTEKEAESKRLNDKKAELDAKIIEENKKFTKDNEALQQELKTLQAELEKQTASLKELQDKNAEVIKAKQAELDAINQEKVGLETKIKEANNKNTSTTEAMDALKKQLESSQEELGTTKTTLETTKGELVKSKGACERNDAKVIELEQLNKKIQKDLEEEKKKNFNSKMGIIQLLDYHIERYQGFQEKIKSATPASVEGLPESASNLKVESTAELKDKSTTKPKDESATSKLGDGNPSSSSDIKP